MNFWNGLINTLAATTNVDVKNKVPSGDNFSADTILAWAIALAGLVAAGFLIKAGLTYVTSQGDPGKAKKALQTIIYSAVGLVVAILAEAIVYFVFNSL